MQCVEYHISNIRIASNVPGYLRFLGKKQKKLLVVSTSNLFNLKSNTMKNTMQS